MGVNSEVLYDNRVYRVIEIHSKSRITIKRFAEVLEVCIQDVQNLD